MWLIFLIMFGALAVGASLLFGWGIPLILILGVLLVGAAVLFGFQRTVAGPTASGEEGEGSEPVWKTKHWWQ